MALARLKTGLIALAATSMLLTPINAGAQDQGQWRTGISTVGELKHPNGFERFDYVNPDAPKGGTLRMSWFGSFDTLNPIAAKGEAAQGIAQIYDTLMTPADDELSSSYGLLAEGLKYPDDFSSVTFKLRQQAKWADGKPVTPEDVIFSLEKAKTASPQYEFYYRHVVAAEKTGEREVTFRFDEPNNRELPQTIGQLVILPKHWWEATGPDGKPRDLSNTTLEIPLGSGPYKVAAVTPGSSIRYERRDDYWGKDLNVNIGQHNFGTIVYNYYADRDVEFQAFKSNNSDFWWDNSARRWATAYDFPAAKDGRIVRETLENEYRKTGVMVGYVFNLRREKFADIRIRKALNYAFDFEELKRTIFYGSYDRIDSFFSRTELASSGLPTGRELEILNDVKDLVPASVFTEPYQNPVNGDPAKLRDNLRKAIGLFKEAGYELKGNRMVNTKTGQPFSFEIMLGGPSTEPVALSFSSNLKKIGIEAPVRTVEESQFTNRWRSRDFDVMYNAWVQTINPGNEQAEFWGSDAAKRDGSSNYSGISDAGIDALIRKVIFAQDRDEKIAATRALDRVLLAHQIVIPSYTASGMNIAYWKNIAHPQNLPEYSMGMPSVWWSTNAGK
ncbi:ABC transporter substrate-binding protein [Agrobacterium larrymoorei]|uniref:extracellular solute-binding protein n=1 Tax=Agrobacterium larrymoorei TaxID=160699 RepID=UPI00157243F1|nr:extracellular solute-binding protein [Agrobacterium larrymoorei]NTJ41097.1 ABC transporter substrate-binding protein [Agrobacterium larrymoorei]